jgi:hypothetical protein
MPGRLELIKKRRGYAPKDQGQACDFAILNVGLRRSADHTEQALSFMTSL